MNYEIGDLLFCHRGRYKGEICLITKIEHKDQKVWTRPISRNGLPTTETPAWADPGFYKENYNKLG